MPVLGVIPARLESTRLSRKPLQLLRGVPLVVRVLDRLRALDVVDEVVVATDAPEVGAVVARYGGRVAMTSPFHQSGTERVREVIARPEFARFDLVVNVQGDEPFVSRAAVCGAVERVRAGDDVGTAAAPLLPEQLGDPARVKVVFDAWGRALYFSRAPIPFARDGGPVAAWQHLGIYAYRPPALERWTSLPPAPLECVEQLEQLRPLFHRMTIGVAALDEPAVPGIDTPADLARAEAGWDAHAMEGR